MKPPKEKTDLELFGENSHALDKRKIPYVVAGAGDLRILSGCPVCQGRLAIAGCKPWHHCATPGCDAREWSFERLLNGLEVRREQ